MFGYYLKQGDVDPAVAALKKCINTIRTSPVPLDDGPTYDSDTRSAVVRLQQLSGLAADGVVGPRTWALLGRKLGYSTSIPTLYHGLPNWARNLLINDPATTKLSGVDILLALELYEKVFSTLNGTQRSGLAFLISKLRTDEKVTDLRWAAYILATVKHECKNSWQPIEEDQASWSTRPYGQPVVVHDKAGTAYTNRYYGRGYVQLTLQRNYRKMGVDMGLGDQLFLRPEKALEPNLAYRILSHGMLTGAFDEVGHHTLRDWISGASCDYVGARATVNGNDCAQLIAGYARDLEVVLLGAVQNMVGVLLGAAASVFAW